MSSPQAQRCKSSPFSGSPTPLRTGVLDPSLCALHLPPPSQPTGLCTCMKLNERLGAQGTPPSTPPPAPHTTSPLLHPRAVCGCHLCVCVCVFVCVYPDPFPSRVPEMENVIGFCGEKMPALKRFRSSKRGSDCGGALLVQQAGFMDFSAGKGHGRQRRLQMLAHIYAGHVTSTVK